MNGRNKSYLMTGIPRSFSSVLKPKKSTTETQYQQSKSVPESRPAATEEDLLKGSQTILKISF